MLEKKEETIIISNEIDQYNIKIISNSTEAYKKIIENLEKLDTATLKKIESSIYNGMLYMHTMKTLYDTHSLSWPYVIDSFVSFTDKKISIQCGKNQFNFKYSNTYINIESMFNAKKL